MPVCPHCNAELPDETLGAEAEAICPACGAAIAELGSDGSLGSLPEGSPADATIALGAEDAAENAAVGESSLSQSDDPSVDSADVDPEMTIDSDFASAAQQAEPEVTIAADGLEVFSEDDESVDLEFDDDGEEEDEDFTFVASEEVSQSLDATIDLCQWARENREEDDPGATSDLPGQPPAQDRTQMAAGGDAPADRPPASDLSDSGSSPSTGEAPNDATLAFDTERRSSGVDTPAPVDITGLPSDQTVPRGRLGEERPSRAVRPGDSVLIGDESVRVRAYSLEQKTSQSGSGADYAIEGEAGAGGMGVVYKARQQSLDRLVAIKQIKAEAGATESDRNKFVSEAVITGQLEHPNIAPVHDLGLAGDGMPFYAMKFVEGEDWEDSIENMTEDENLRILIQVAQAIAFSHSKNVVHRDLKPGNVRLGSFGEVLVMDWGLAARLDDGSEIQPAGTPLYMPPETALDYLDFAKRRVQGGGVDTSRRRVPPGKYGDIYLLGALLFKIVTGKAPHRGKTTFECLRNAARNEIVKVRRTSELLNIAYKAMATEPEDRYETAIDFIEAVQAYQAHAQSIQIAKRASTDLREAGRLVEEGSDDRKQIYDLFSSAQYGYLNALDLWDGNDKARRRLLKARRMFAEAAYAGGDYDLALSLLDEQQEDEAELRTAVVAAQRNRKARLAWFRTLQYATAASLLLAICFIAYSFVLKQDALSLASRLEETQGEIDRAIEEVGRKQEEADAATRLAEEKSLLAVEKQRLADEKSLEVDRLTTAVEQKQRAAEEATRRAEASEKLAAQKQREADAAALLARQQTEEAQRQAYFAAIGRIRATLSDQGAYAAWKELQQVDPEVARFGENDPAWGFLTRAVDWRKEATELVGEDPNDSQRPTQLAVTADGALLAALAPQGPGGGELTIYRGDQPAKRLPLAAPGPIAIDARGEYVAVAGGPLRVVRLSDGALLTTVGSAEQTLCVAFHPSEPELLAGVEGTGVQRWRIVGDQLQLLQEDQQWHRDEVVAVGYSPQGKQRFSADKSGQIVVWRGGEADPPRVTLRHRGAARISAVALADDAQGRLAYGCDDGSVFELFGWWESPPAGDGSDGYTAASSERLATMHPGRVRSMAYDDQGRTILSAGGDTILVRPSPTLSDEQRASLVARRTMRRYHDATVLACVPGTEGFAYSSDERGRVVRWRVDAKPDQIVYASARGRAPAVTAARLDREAGEEALIATDQAGFIRQWRDLELPRDPLVSFTGHADHRDTRAWRLGGEQPLIVTVAADHRACVWSEQEEDLLRTIDLGGRTVVAIDTVAEELIAASDGRPIEQGVAAMAYPLRGGTPRTLWDDAARVSALEPLTGADPAGPTIAVGLRDGQVYLWGPETGRIDLVRSSRRPHWRELLAMTYDPSSETLYTADRGALIAAWDLASRSEPLETLLRESENDTMPITRLELTPAGELLVVRQSPRKTFGVLYNKQLKPVDEQVIEAEGLIDLTYDTPQRRFLGLQRDGELSHVLASRAGDAWRRLVSTRSELVGLRSQQGGVVTWGPGFAQWRVPRQQRLPIAARVVSRPPVTEIIASGPGVQTLTDLEEIESWREGVAPVDQIDLPVPGDIVATCEAQQAGELLVAITTPTADHRLERWNALTGERAGVLVEQLPSRVFSLALSGDQIAVGMAGQIGLVAAEGGPLETIPLVDPAWQPVSIAAHPSESLLAIVTQEGQLLLVHKASEEGWEVARVERKGIASAAFSDNPDALWVGVESGRVELLHLGEATSGVVEHRTLLTLPGHADRVTSLRVIASRDGSRLLSADASGRVVLRQL